MNWAAVFWLVMIVVFLLVEAATVALVSTWFALGSLAAMLVRPRASCLACAGPCRSQRASRCSPGSTNHGKSPSCFIFLKISWNFPGRPGVRTLRS